MNVEGKYVLLAVQLDESLLLVGQLDVLGIVPTVAVVNQTSVVVPFSFVACAGEDGVAVEDILAGSIVVAASQIDGTGKELVGREGAAYIDVSNDAAGCPLVRGTAAPGIVRAVGSCVFFPEDGQGIPIVVGKVEVPVIFLGTHVEAWLKPLFPIGIGFGLAYNHVVV